MVKTPPSQPAPPAAPISSTKPTIAAGPLPFFFLSRSLCLVVSHCISFLSVPSFPSTTARVVVLLRATAAATKLLPYIYCSPSLYISMSLGLFVSIHLTRSPFPSLLSVDLVSIVSSSFCFFSFSCDAHRKQENERFLYLLF